MKWFRLYDEIIDNPKILTLNEDLRWWYIAILCIINRLNRESGRLPDIRNVSLFLRQNREAVETIIDKLVEVKLLQKDKHGYFCQAFKNRQYNSDNTTDRVKRYRKRFKEVPDAVTETDSSSSIINYLITMGMASTVKKAYAQIGLLKRDYGASDEIIKEVITKTYGKYLGGDTFKIAYIISECRRIKSEQKEESSIFDME